MATFLYFLLDFAYQASLRADREKQCPKKIFMPTFAPGPMLFGLGLLPLPEIKNKLVTNRPESHLTLSFSIPLPNTGCLKKIVRRLIKY